VTAFRLLGMLLLLEPVYMHWKVNQNFTISVAAYADPEEAVKQAAERTKNFAYGVVYVAYSC
jgi:hypothetical protein